MRSFIARAARGPAPACRQAEGLRTKHGAADHTRVEEALPYTYSAVLHNFGGDYLDKSRKPALCSKEAQAATTFYATLLKDFGPLGVINYIYYQNVPCTARARRRWISKPPTN